MDDSLAGCGLQAAQKQSLAHSTPRKRASQLQSVVEAKRHVDRHLAEEQQSIAPVPSQEHKIVDKRRRLMLIILMHGGRILPADGCGSQLTRSVRQTVESYSVVETMLRATYAELARSTRQPVDSTGSHLPFKDWYFAAPLRNHLRPFKRIWYVETQCFTLCTCMSCQSEASGISALPWRALR